jgi:hypothetical protein
VTALVMPRSILTENVARRGFHVSREYAIDPLEILFVREVMQPGRRRCAHPHVANRPNATWEDSIPSRGDADDNTSRRPDASAQSISARTGSDGAPPS